jgi:AsmA protein
MLKWLLIGAGVLVLVMAASLAALPWFLNTPAFQSYVAQSASQALNRPVRFTSLSISPFPLPTVKLRGLHVAEDPGFGPGPFVIVKEGRMRIALRPLLSRRIELADLTLHAPRIDLVEDARGRWNWASLGVPGPSAAGPARGGGRLGGPSMTAVLLSRVRIVDGTMGYRRLGAARSDLAVEKVNLTIAQTAPGAALVLHGDAVAQPGNVELKIREGTLTPAGARSFADMALKATVDVEARDVAPLGAALAPAPVMTGPMKGRLQISGSPARVVATGDLVLSRLTLSDERPRCEPRRRQLLFSDLRVPVSYTMATLDSVPLEAKLARGAVSLRLGVALGSAPTAALKNINVKGVELGPILVDFFCQPYAVTGPLDLTGEASLHPADPWQTLNGAGRLRIGAGRVMGREVVTLVREVVALAGVAAAVLAPEQRVRSGSPLDFDSITASYTITNGVLKTTDLLYRAADVSIASAGTVTLEDGRVNMDVTLTQGPNRVKGVVSGTAGALRVVPTSIQVPDARGIRKFLDQILR